MGKDLRKQNNAIRVFAWIALTVLIMLIMVLAYAFITADGNLAMAMIFAIIFISVILYICARIFKLNYKKYSEGQSLSDITSKKL